MNCETALELLSASLDGELTAAEQAELQAHLDQCPGCRAIQTELAGLHAACGEMEALPPAGLKERIMENLPPQRPGKVVYWKRWGAMAAALALVALAAWRLPHSLYDRSTAEPQNEESAVVTAEDAAELSPESMTIAGGATNGTEDGRILFTAYDATQAVAEDGGLADFSAPVPAAKKSKAAVQQDADTATAGGDGEPMAKYSQSAAPMGRMALQPSEAGEPVYAVNSGDTDAIPELVPNPGEEPVAAQSFEPMEEDGRDFSRYRAVVTLRGPGLAGDYPRQMQENGDMWYLLPLSELENALGEGGFAYELRTGGDDLTPDASDVLVIVPAAR